MGLIKRILKAREEKKKNKKMNALKIEMLQFIQDNAGKYTEEEVIRHFKEKYCS